MALTGFNWTGFWSIVDVQTTTWIIEALIRGQSICCRYRNDDGHVSVGDLDKLIALHIACEAADVHLPVIFTAEVQRPGSEIDQKADLDYVIDAGVNVVGVEFGNETYSNEQFAFVFGSYKTAYTPLLNLVIATYPSMKCLVFLAPRPNAAGLLTGTQSHDTWNGLAFTETNTITNLEPTIHIYFGAEAPGVFPPGPPTGIVYDPDVYNSELDDFYTTLWVNTVTNFSLFENLIAYIEENTNKKPWVTEFGYDNYNAVRNTLGDGMFLWKIWNTFGNDSRIAALCQHAISGAINAVSNKDTNPDLTLNKRRIAYWVYKMYREISDEGAIPLPQVLVNLTPGEYRYWYSNFDQTYVATLGNVILNEGQSISGDHIYSTSGKAQWMADGTVPSYEVDGIYASTSAAQLSFGERHITLNSITMPPTTSQSVSSACEPCYAYTLPACPDITEEGAGIIIKAGLTPDTEYDWYLEDKFGKISHDTATTNGDGDLTILYAVFPAGYFTPHSGVFNIYIKESDETPDVVPLALGNSYLAGEYECINLNFAEIQSDNTTIE